MQLHSRGADRTPSNRPQPPRKEKVDEHRDRSEELAGADHPTRTNPVHKRPGERGEQQSDAGPDAQRKARVRDLDVMSRDVVSGIRP